MSKVRIVQCLCPQRHCMLACVYLSADGEADPDMTEALRKGVEDMATERLLNPWCGICNSRDLRYEDAATPYATMEEARGPIAEVAARPDCGGRGAADADARILSEEQELMKIALDDKGSYLEPDEGPRDTRWHMRITHSQRIASTHGGHWLYLACGHRAMAFGNLDYAGGVVLCTQCRDQEETKL